jgi:mannose-6-phosphate isomerase-like protein (cupin superfamily)
MKYIFQIGDKPNFDKRGHRGYFFGTQSDRANHLIIETDIGLEGRQTENICEYAYYVLDGSGIFEINGVEHPVQAGCLVVIPPKTTFTYRGKLRMLLINTPVFTSDQEVVES